MLGNSRLALLSLLVMLAAFMPAASTYAASDRLPDLRMARLRDLSIENTTDGRRRLRFSAVIANVGVGNFEIRGQRPNTSSGMTVEQRIFDDAGGSRYITTPATMVFGGDGHNHWHVRNLQTYDLVRLDNGVKVGTAAKSGFCFFDNEIFGALTDPVYTSSNACRGGSTGLSTMMGLSIRWADIYAATLPDQYIDITGLGAGRYRLLATADNSNWFREANETNNQTWVDIQLTGSGFNILGYGPAATPQGNLLKNRGFELDSNNDGRPDNWTSNSVFTRSSEVVLKGSYAGKHFATDNSGYSIAQTVFNVFEGTTYSFSGSVYIRNPNNDTFTFNLRVAWLDGSGVTIRNDIIKAYTNTAPQNVWDLATARIVAPPGTAKAQFRMVASNLNATIYVDDFMFGPA
jgi:hypothetical protein